MLETITLLGRTLPMYGVMAAVGFAAALGAVCIACARCGRSKENGVYLFVFGAVGAALGAKLLYLITVLPELIADLPLLAANPSLFLATYLTGGMVFYGGLAGAVIGVRLFARYMKFPLEVYLPALVPAIPLMHAFGRVGCFFAGCCYGVPVPAKFGVVFASSHIAPGGVPLFPVQLVEAACEFVIFCVLFTLVCGRRKPVSGGGMLALYVLLYAPVRFVLEFFRGDAARGFLLGLSTSQWLSLAAGFGAVIWLACARRKISDVR